MMWSCARAAQNTPAEVRHSAPSPKPGVFRSGLLKNRDVGVGVLPQCEEVLKGFSGFRRVAREHRSAHTAQVGKRIAQSAIRALVIQDLVELGRYLDAIAQAQERTRR